MVKHKALEEIKYQNEYFDEDFIAYKEDIDMSWRMHAAGFDVLYQPNAIAWHARTIQSDKLANRRAKSEVIRAYSYRNHLWTLIKNEQFATFAKDFIFIIPYEISKFVYICIFEWSTVKIFPQVLKEIKKIRRKRLPEVKQSIKPWIK